MPAMVDARQMFVFPLAEDASTIERFSVFNWVTSRQTARENGYETSSMLRQKLPARMSLDRIRAMRGDMTAARNLEQWYLWRPIVIEKSFG
jgi:hypothetical protein